MFWMRTVFPQNVLTSLTQENESEYWNLVVPHALKVLRDTPCYNDPDLIVDRSVTEYQFKFAMKNPITDSKRCIWLRRTFTDNKITKNEDSKSFSQTLLITNQLSSNSLTFWHIWKAR